MYSLQNNCQPLLNSTMMMFIQDVFFTKQLLTAAKFSDDNVYTRCILYKTIVNCC